MKTLALLAIICFTSDSPQVPNKSAAQTDNTSNSKGTAPFTVVNNCSPSYETKQEPNCGPRGGTSIWANVPNWLLVGVGIITFFAVWKQAVETRKAAEATQESAAASKASTDILIASERAWISIKSDMANFNPTGTPSGFYWRAMNTGKTPAKLISTNVRCLVWNGYDTLPNTPEFEENTEIRLNGRILTPGEIYPFHGGYFEDWENGAYSHHNMNNRFDSTPDTLYLLMYGRIRYQALGKDCESNFVEDYTWVKSEPIPTNGFRQKLEAPPAYSNHT
jgi:hypothetical protein